MKDESCVVLSEATGETHHRQFSSLQIQETGCNPHFCLSSGLAQTQRRTSTKIRRCIVNEHYQDTSFKIYRDSEFYDSSRYIFNSITSLYLFF